MKKYEGHTPEFDPLPGLRLVADKLNKGIQEENAASLQLGIKGLSRIIAALADAEPAAAAPELLRQRNLLLGMLKRIKKNILTPTGLADDVPLQLWDDLDDLVAECEEEK